MHQWGVHFWFTYSPVANLMSIGKILNLIILKEIHTKSVDFVLDYTQYYVESEIVAELPLGFGFEEDHTR